ncbi:hypothetical protein IFT72_04640 [Frigoribacterium sp. CFBP 8754]|jgi:uncharacterized membrane protein|uniref:hypothetical protein n=1 Tax=unclassified Frigoribacterium TaxID=2627005 RepID=UPI001786FFE6|nr:MULTISPECIES: hypothetical protein [unclassified Frigoribacterium]MBD8659473.1 hypothetical protein [Frigoribacterium sp. CFBP 8754]MBD8728038.1 hypothetical protein [Frigoribacterium sp. CFBP 13707]
MSDTPPPAPTTASLAITAGIAFLGLVFAAEALLSPDGSWVTIVVGAVIAVVYGVRTALAIRRRRAAKEG